MKNLAPFYPAIVVLIGALIVSAGGFWASYRQSNFNIELRKKNDEIAVLQKDNADAITGGDSFAEVVFQVLDQAGRQPNGLEMPDDLLLAPLIVHRGKHPLYDVSVRISETGPNTIGKFDLKTYPIGNLSSGLATTTTMRIPHKGKSLSYNIFFTARNGSWHQFLRMPWVGNGWAIASKVLRDRDGKILFRNVSENFPRNEKDQVDWGETAAQD